MEPNLIYCSNKCTLMIVVLITFGLTHSQENYWWSMNKYATFMTWACNYVENNAHEIKVIGNLQPKWIMEEKNYLKIIDKLWDSTFYLSWIQMTFLVTHKSEENK
jgi:hypothetical protein